MCGRVAQRKARGVDWTWDMHWLGWEGEGWWGWWWWCLGGTFGHPPDVHKSLFALLPLVVLLVVVLFCCAFNACSGDQIQICCQPKLVSTTPPPSIPPTHSLPTHTYSSYTLTRTHPASVWPPRKISCEHTYMGLGGILVYIELRLTDDCLFLPVQWKSYWGNHPLFPSPLLTPTTCSGAHLMFIKFMKISAMIYDSFGGARGACRPRTCPALPFPGGESF